MEERTTVPASSDDDFIDRQLNDTQEMSVRSAIPVIYRNIKVLDNGTIESLMPDMYHSLMLNKYSDNFKAGYKAAIILTMRKEISHQRAKSLRDIKKFIEKGTSDCVYFVVVLVCYYCCTHTSILDG